MKWASLNQPVYYSTEYIPRVDREYSRLARTGVQLDMVDVEFPSVAIATLAASITDSDHDNYKLARQILRSPHITHEQAIATCEDLVTTLGFTGDTRADSRLVLAAARSGCFMPVLECVYETMLRQMYNNRDKGYLDWLHGPRIPLTRTREKYSQELQLRTWGDATMLEYMALLSGHTVEHLLDIICLTINLVSADILREERHGNVDY